MSFDHSQAGSFIKFKQHRWHRHIDHWVGRSAKQTCEFIGVISLEMLIPSQTIISQDVALFQGTIRTNLDPFEQYSDEECLQVLDRCHLTPILRRGGPEGADPTNILHIAVTKGGSFSAGERQLLALARAVLRRTNIVIMVCALFPHKFLS